MNFNLNKFHKDFKLNNNSFTTVDELLIYIKSFSTEIYQFLEEWFSENEFVVVQTSGSTGKPKLIQLQKEQMLNSAFATRDFFNLNENTTALLCLPVAYIAGKMMLVRAITLGWSLDVILSNSNPLKGVSKVYDFSAMVPLQVESSIYNLNKIKKLIVGGGVVSNKLQKSLESLSTEVYATYGMTETITHIAVKKLNKLTLENKNKEFYKILPNTTIYIDERNCLVIKNSKVSNKIIFTNDVVRLVSNTQFEWLGRFDNVINSGGIKLHPEKIEEKLSKIIEERFFVTGIPDEKLGEKLVLIIESSVCLTLLKDKIKELDILSKFEIPKDIYFVDNFIETETKKIQRKKTMDLIKF
tara:strand:+ start:4213 stop:5280 length:1068 start_codon:yes stop_codon:yes gene_type:complete